MNDIIIDITTPEAKRLDKAARDLELRDAVIKGAALAAVTALALFALSKY